MRNSPQEEPPPPHAVSSHHLQDGSAYLLLSSFFTYTNLDAKNNAENIDERANPNMSSIMKYLGYAAIAQLLQSPRSWVVLAAPNTLLSLVGRFGIPKQCFIQIFLCIGPRYFYQRNLTETDHNYLCSSCDI